MGYSEQEDSILRANEFHSPKEQQQRLRSRVVRTLIICVVAALGVWVLASASLLSIFSLHHGYGGLWRCQVPGTAEGDHCFIIQKTTGMEDASSGSIVRRHYPPAVPLIREIGMTRTNDSREGQPVIAVNPRNPNNLVYTSTRFPALPELEPLGGCFLAYSFDRGLTWTNVTANYPLGTAPKCGEPQVFPDENGTFYILNNQVFSGLEDNMAAHPQLSKSTDGGQTWSIPSVTPLHMQGATKLRVDLATGKVYANGASSWEYPAAVSVSSDGGATWAPFNQIPGPVDSCLDYEIPGIPPVCGFPGRSIAVYDGILASAAEGDDGNPEMYISRDDGVTWKALPLTDSDGNLVANGTGSMLAVAGVGLPSDPTPWVSADPTKTGRFALMVPRNFTLEIYVTEDSGEHFRGPTIIETPDAQRPAVDFGSTGLLGVMWRTNSSGILDAYSTVSFDCGRTFAIPLKVTHKSVPVGQNGQPGDRASFIALTGEYAYVAWSDGRDGFLDAVLAEIPIKLFK